MEFSKTPQCPICGKPDPAELYFDCRLTGKHMKRKSDIVGCDKCISIEYDLGDIADILLEE